MKEFLDVYEQHQLRLGLNLQVYHSSIVDWRITVGYKPTHPKFGEEVVSVQDSDCEYAFAQAQIKLKDWLLKSEDGY